MTKIEEVARAMEAKRRELIAQPLNRIWPELARAAIEAMRKPTVSMTVAGWKEADRRDAILGNGEIALVYQAMIDSALSEGEERG